MTETEMRRDDRVFNGEEVAGIQWRLQGKPGYARWVWPQKEWLIPHFRTGFCGRWVGAAQNGLRPVVEFMTWNFAVLALDQIPQYRFQDAGNEWRPG